MGQELSGKVAIVTGGANGIGRATVELIINTTSTAAIKAGGGVMTYRASKAAVIQVSKSISQIKEIMAARTKATAR